jgi:hypothetical protein
LINMIGPGDYREEWRQALNQYFSLVRVFDAVHADFDTRVGLLRAFCELDERWRAPLEKAVAALTAERRRRRHRSAQALADCLVDALTLTERVRLADESERERLGAELTERLRMRIRARERRCRDAVQEIYRHESLEWRERTEALLTGDLFAVEGWELFGLSQGQLALSGAVAGAVAGGGIDVLLGGASLLLGAGIGALIGGVGAWLGGGEIAKVRILGESLGGRVLQVGPVTAPNFPWVLLGRGWVHHQLVAERNHAYREVLSAAMLEDQHLMDALPDELRKALAGLFRTLSIRGEDAELRRTLTARIEELLALNPARS